MKEIYLATKTIGEFNKISYSFKKQKSTKKLSRYQLIAVCDSEESSEKVEKELNRQKSIAKLPTTKSDNVASNISLHIAMLHLPDVQIKERFI